MFLADPSGNTLTGSSNYLTFVLTMNGSFEQGQLGGRLIQSPVIYRQHSGFRRIEPVMAGQHSVKVEITGDRGIDDRSDRVAVVFFMA